MKIQDTQGQRSTSERPRAFVDHSLCRCGAGKRAGVAARLLLGVALMTGCSFTDFSKTSTPETDGGVAAEPACLKPTIVSDAGVGLVAHWTFDDVLSNGPWLDDKQAHLLTPGADEQADAGVATLVLHPSINGGGQSLLLDGHQFVRSDPDTVGDRFDELYGDLFSDQFTLAAWISVPARVFTSNGPAPFIWPILSTLSDDKHCNGYQLDIRFQSPPAQPELVFSCQAVELNDASVPECMTLSLQATLDIPSWATGIGRWHHVAGTRSKLGNERPQLALYWDGKRIQLQDPLEPLVPVLSGLPEGERALYLGASAPNASSAAQTKFSGYIDDLAIFNRPLTEQELANFVLDSTTRPGPSNCRWRASEQWDKTAYFPSYAQWATQNPDGLTVHINDQDWGAGALDARMVPPRDLQLYDRAILDAVFPVGQAFQFTLASGDNYCTWVYLGRGSKRYEIDLTKPVNCVSSSCSVDFHRVDRASVTSEWAIPNDSAGDAGTPGKRTQGEEPFTVRSLEFVPAAGTLPDWTAYGGVVGPGGYCWRLQAYEPETSAQWKQGSKPWSDSVAATLNGPKISGTRVVADFGERPIDIINCATITIDAELENTSDSTIAYAFVVEDEYGSWRSYDLSPVAKNDVDLSSRPTASSDGSSKQTSTENFARFPRPLDFKRVRLLGIQKPWGYQGELNVILRGLQFFDAQGGPNCERPGVN